MTGQSSRDNHYVPQWYQRGFMEPGKTKLYYLDMSPGRMSLPDGRSIPMKALQKKGPPSCFCEYDLYSTHFGDVVNDEIEKFLFGSIDRKGSIAVRAFSENDFSAIHHSFQDFFEYMDAQKIRTPKGLNWIKSQYSSLDQVQLMVEMQNIRSMNCIMWTECVREIVSAEDSDIKFIVSDHPVTVYNAAHCPVTDKHAYPEDPPVEWVGTQTVFALNANTCLILTHIEYAKNQTTTNLTVPRTNARYRGQSLSRTDAFIRTRKLMRNEVVAINYLLKSRAGRYVAASSKEWLYPEESFAGRWQDIGQTLLPKDDLWKFGGETFIVYADDSTQYQDAFGRTSGSHEYLRREQRATALRANEACGCGSGRKFKNCCKDVPLADRPTWDVYSIRERNLMLCNAVQDILGLASGKTWEDVRRELDDYQVRRIHEAFAHLWPEDTDLAQLLPRPKKGIVRAVYLGPCDPRTVQLTALGWLPYFDEIVLAHPFPNPLLIKPEMSPTHSPSQYKVQTLKNVLLLLLLEPYIHAGLVHLIPDPGDFSRQFRTTTLRMAEQRTATWKPIYNTYGLLQMLSEDDYHRSILQLSESSLRSFISQQITDAPDVHIEAIVAAFKSESSNDPYVLLQEFDQEYDGGQFLIIKGYNLESAMYLALMTGSNIYTDVEEHWKQLHAYALNGDRSQNTNWEPVVNALRAVKFPLELNTDMLLSKLQQGRLASFRPALRQFTEAVQETGTTQRSVRFSAQIDQAALYLQREWEKMPDPRMVGRIDLSVPLAGFERHEVQRLLITFGGVKTARPLPYAMLISFEENSIKPN